MTSSINSKQLLPIGKEDLLKRVSTEDECPVKPIQPGDPIMIHQVAHLEIYNKPLCYTVGYIYIYIQTINVDSGSHPKIP